jgi:hypothetical protein
MADLGLISAAMAKSTICRGEKISNGGESHSSGGHIYFKIYPKWYPGHIAFTTCFYNIGVNLRSFESSI